MFDLNVFRYPQIIALLASKFSSSIPNSTPHLQSGLDFLIFRFMNLNYNHVLHIKMSIRTNFFTTKFSIKKRVGWNVRYVPSRINLEIVIVLFCPIFLVEFIHSSYKLPVLIEMHINNTLLQNRVIRTPKINFVSI